MVAGQLHVPDDRFAAYLRRDELHVGLTGHLLDAPFGAEPVRAAIEAAFAAVRGTGALPSWTISDHDVPRPVTRYGGGPVGLARARAMALVQLALPGTVYLYNGEELGLPDADLPDDVRRDPRRAAGRDGCRVPLPWEDGPPGFGFTSGEPWLPMPARWEAETAAAQAGDSRSTLELYRAALRVRPRGEPFAWRESAAGTLVFARGPLVCAVNVDGEPLPLPDGELVVASEELAGGALQAGAAAWVRT
jgi:alpha-glucosidase